MNRYLDTLRCDGCGAEITWSPVLSEGRAYCCEECCQGRPCDCGDRMDFADERRENAGGLSAME